MIQVLRSTVRTARSGLWVFVAAGLSVFCLLSSSAPSLARPPAQPNGPVALPQGATKSASGLAFAVVPWRAYAAAAAVIFGGTALYALAVLRRESKEKRELMGQLEIELLAEHAAALAVLYGRYCQRFRALHPLWEALAADEQKHSRWIGEFAGRIRRGEGCLQRRLFPYGRVSNALGQVQQFTRDADRSDLTEAIALRNALLQERERDEWRLPDLFAISSGKFGTVLELLHSEGQAHQRAISGVIEGG